MHNVSTQHMAKVTGKLSVILFFQAKYIFVIDLIIQCVCVCVHNLNFEQLRAVKRDLAQVVSLKYFSLTLQ